jgi:hypothetical protein
MRSAIELVMYKVELRGCLENYIWHYFQLDKCHVRSSMTLVGGSQVSILGQRSEVGPIYFRA